MGSWLRGIVTRARRSPVRFSLVAATAITLVAATTYLGTASVMWHLRVGELERATTDLTDALASQTSATNHNVDQIAALGDALDEARADIIAEAHRKALMQDDQIVYREVAATLKECADERAKVVPVVQNRRSYILWTVHAYDDTVTFDCDPVVSALHEQMVGESQ